jgi:polar amino acid transport system substrate-binding protein
MSLYFHFQPLMLRPFSLALFGLLFWLPAQAQTTLKVATREVHPFVVKQNDKLTGFSVDLWEAIASELNVQSRYAVKRNVGELLDAVKKKDADLSVAAISVTAKRDREVDFSQPIYDSGLQILVRGEASAPSLMDGLIAVLRSPILGQFIIAVAILILLPAHILWLIERRSDDGIIRHKGYFPGIFEAVWWTVSCLATQAEEMPKTVWARVLAVIWMFFAIIFIAYVTAALTANLTLQSLRGDIRGPEDLPGKRVATVSSSTSAEYLREASIRARSFATLDEAFAALNNKQVEAVVYDAPILLYYAANKGKGNVSVVGPVFRKESYAIAFPNNSKWRKPVNFALLTLRENGTYDRLHDKWFGSENP